MTTIKKQRKTFVASAHCSFVKCLLFIAVALGSAIAGADAKQVVVPEIIGSRGYINPTPLTSHVMAPFSSFGSTTLVAYVSSHPSWKGRPVSIIGLDDDVGNTWKLLEGPTTWTGSSATLLSAIFYVNGPITADAYTVTVRLSNPAPLVVHVVAVSGSNIMTPPLHSAIAGLKVGQRSTEVTTDSMAFPDHTLLLAWSKNEVSATANAIDGYALDAQSTGFLWGEHKIVPAAGCYASHFRYNTAIGHQTAILGIQAASFPVASNVAVSMPSGKPVNVALSALAPAGRPLNYSLVNLPRHGRVSGLFPNLTYTPETDYVGTDTLAFKVSDGIHDSNLASVRFTVRPKPIFQPFQETPMKMVLSIIIPIVVTGASVRAKGSSWLESLANSGTALCEKDDATHF
jgi:hypothetical protein